MKTKIKPSKYQQALYDFIKLGKGNAVVSAVAGSGKSTSIVNALELTGNKRCLFLAFNVAIVDELKIKIRPKRGLLISTVHSIGFSMLRDMYADIKVNARKYISLISNNITTDYMSEIGITEEYAEMYVKNIKTLVNILRLTISMNKESAMRMVERYDIKLVKDEVRQALRIINMGIKNIKEVDYNDMIFMPQHMKLQCSKYDFVFVDEAQDQNACQRAITMMSLKKDGRFIAVGDPYQAIYGFSGSDIESYNILKSMPNTTELPLSVCYRCSSKIVELAKEFVSSIEARDNAPEGKIIYNGKIKDIKINDMILCRNTAPLMRLAMLLLAENKPVRIAGKDLGKNLIKIVKATGGKNIKSCLMVMERNISEYEKSLKNLGYIDDEIASDNEYELMKDQQSAIAIISEGITTFEEFEKKIEQLFNDDNDTIVLSSVHRSKGLEAKRVWILNASLMPSPHAKQDWQIQQEENLIYIAITRAKEMLGYINIDNKKLAEPKSIYLNEQVTVNEYIGNIGDEIDAEVTIEDRQAIITKFGSTSKHIFRDNNGRIMIKIGSPQINRFNIGDIITIKAVISKHSEFRGVKETWLGNITVSSSK